MLRKETIILIAAICIVVSFGSAIIYLFPVPHQQEEKLMGQRTFTGLYYGYAVSNRIGDFENIWITTMKLGTYTLSNVTISNAQAARLEMFIGKNTTLVLDEYTTFYNYIGAYLSPENP